VLGASITLLLLHPRSGAGSTFLASNRVIQPHLLGMERF
jgi:hypothetical protein